LTRILKRGNISKSAKQKAKKAKQIRISYLADNKRI